ncbi:O-antigen ligase family protein [Aequorivita marisscotiae]|uniref:O-antigen ligase domain-containing protein n=1 Tax=Aequorivita marisscotiae TaxID=3040348 RepID=A0ABY8KUH5_9FLAO|nr:hypothetical protein [Aequorivita sp. Ant34-E75]WGF92214.1 hypothetical protein QCQ61_13515 [Aequorivita sp. Ant34-E75]
MQQDKYICNFLLLLVLVYYSQGVIYPMGSIISQTTLLLIMLISLVYFVKELFFVQSKFTLFIKAWTALLLLIVAGFFLKGDFENYRGFQSTLLNMVPFYAFYYFSKKDVLTKKHLIVLFIILAPMIVYRFTQSNISLQAIREREDVIDNTIYMFLGLIPFVFLFKRKVFSIIALLIFWIFIVQSAKRAAIVCGVFGILLFFYYQLKTVNSRYQIRNYTVILIIFFGLSYWGYEYLLENEFLMVRLQSMMEGDSSGRDNIARIAFATWYESNNIFIYLFGNGFQTTADVSANNSHNDWIELLVSFGLLGFTIYAILFYSALKEIYSGNFVFNKKIMFICLIGIAIITSLTSRWYGSSFAYSQILLLPYLLATKDNSIKK